MMKRDRKETTKYLHDLNEQTPFKCLTINYIDQVRAVLNYGCLVFNCFKHDEAIESNPSEGTGSSPTPTPTPTPTPNTGKDTNNDDVPTVCKATVLSVLPPNKALLTGTALTDDGTPYGILITAMIRTKEQEALLHTVVNVKGGAEEFTDSEMGSWTLLTRMFISSMNLANLGEDDDMHTNPTASNKDWFTRINLPIEIDISTYGHTKEYVEIPYAISGIDDSNKHLWGAGFHDVFKESYGLNYGHTFIQDPDTITITRATREEQDAYLRIGDEYSPIPNSPYQAMNIVKRVDLVDVINSGNDITIKSCLKVVPDESAPKHPYIKSDPEPYDKNVHYKLIETPSGRVIHKRKKRNIVLEYPENNYLMPFDLKVGEELSITITAPFGSEYSVFPEEMDSDNTDDWKLRGLNNELLNLRFVEGNEYKIKVNTLIDDNSDADNTTQLTIFQNSYNADDTSFRNTCKILRVSPFYFRIRFEYVHTDDYTIAVLDQHDYTVKTKDVYVHSTKLINSFTLKFIGKFFYLDLNKYNHFGEIRQSELTYSDWGTYPFIKWTSYPDGISKYNIIKEHSDSEEEDTNIYKCELREGMHFLIDTSSYKDSDAVLNFTIQPIDKPSLYLYEVEVIPSTLKNPFIEVYHSVDTYLVIDNQVKSLDNDGYDKLCITSPVHRLLPIWVLIEDTGQVFEYPNE